MWFWNYKPGPGTSPLGDQTTNSPTDGTFFWRDVDGSDTGLSALGLCTMALMHIDVHQHIWTTALVDKLAERDTLPLVQREQGLTVLHSAGELPYIIDVESETPERRGVCVADDGLDLAVVAISSPIGIEALPREAALELIDAHLDGVLALPPQFAAWGPIALDRA